VKGQRILHILSALRRRPEPWQARAPAYAGARRVLSTAAALLVLAGCATTSPPANPQDRFFAELTRHCGKAYAGALVTTDAADADMRGQPMVMHVRRCTPDRIEIPFHIATGSEWDRSRTWVITRTATGLRLKHDHRHADGQPDVLTMYGGDAGDTGSAARQSFPVDAESIALFRANDRAVSVTNIWAVEVDATRFAYELRRSGRYFRVEFDLGQPVPAPPAPWGW
jgi:hypothetical protein